MPPTSPVILNHKSGATKGVFHNFEPHKLSGVTSVTITNGKTNGHVIIDVVRFVPVRM